MVNENWNKIDDVELVVVSPCRRTLETARSIFQNKHVNIIAKDFLIELLNLLIAFIKISAPFMICILDGNSEHVAHA